MRFAAIVEYIGSNYSGFQIQKGAITIQHEIQSALSKIANTPIKIITSGRTDAGVHALGQVFHFDCDTSRTNKAWLKGCNSFLPDDIVIKWISQVEDTFHARFHAVQREYQYLLYCDPIRSAVWENLSGWFFYDIDINILENILEKFIGEHDFSSFRSSSCQSKKPIKNIYKASYEVRSKFILFKFIGDGFLHHQIRNMMSVILDVATKKKEIDYIDYLFKIKDRTKASNTFSPKGLYLANIEYDNKYGIPKIRNNVFI